MLELIHQNAIKTQKGNPIFHIVTRFICILLRFILFLNVKSTAQIVFLKLHFSKYLMRIPKLRQYFQCFDANNVQTSNKYRRQPNQFHLTDFPNSLRELHISTIIFSAICVIERHSSAGWLAKSMVSFGKSRPRNKQYLH